MLNISIPQPCHEDWNAMTPADKGAFCAVCSKVVVDFSVMNDDEVKNYFLLNAGKRTCGRFRKSQLKGLNIVVDEQVIYTSMALWKKFLAVVVICFSAFFTSCSATKEKAAPDSASTVTEYTMLGASYVTCNKKIPVDTPPGPPLPNSANPEIKVITVTCDCIQGEIAPPVPIQADPSPVLMGVPEIEPMPIPKDTAKKVVDTCSNAVFL